VAAAIRTVQEFPEVDRAAWFPLDEAADRIRPEQRPFLDEMRGLATAAGGRDAGEPEAS
jgi:predicted NUDIX family NTP pyrophosphohydrolase